MNDSHRGALISLAVRAAFGAAVELSSAGSFARVAGYRCGGPHGLRAAEWTDDTSMAGGWAVVLAGGEQGILIDKELVRHVGNANAP